MLARGGARAVILERQRVIGDALCGGFLSWRTLQQLDRLGVQGLSGHPINGVRVFAGDKVASARLPAQAVGLSRHRLDTVMLDHAVKVGAVRQLGTARSIIGDTVQTDSGEMAADSIFLATGKSDLRGEARPKTGDDDPTLGLRVRLEARPRLVALIGANIELHLFDRGYAGLLMQEDGSANLCMAVRKSRLAEAGGRPATLLAELVAANPHLGERLGWMERMPDADAVAAVPYGWRALDTKPGLFRLGDQAAVIPSLAGEGMGIAVASGVAAAKAWGQGGAGSAPRYQQDFAERTRRPVALARLLWERGEHHWSAALAVRAIRIVPSLASFFASATRID